MCAWRAGVPGAGNGFPHCVPIDLRSWHRSTASPPLAPHPLVNLGGSCPLSPPRPPPPPRRTESFDCVLSCRASWPARPAPYPLAGGRGDAGAAAEPQGAAQTVSQCSAVRPACRAAGQQTGTPAPHAQPGCTAFQGGSPPARLPAPTPRCSRAPCHTHAATQCNRGCITSGLPCRCVPLPSMQAPCRTLP